MTKKLISVGLAPDVVKIVDSVRGDVPRSLYLRKLITEVIYKKVNGNLTNEQKAAITAVQAVAMELLTIKEVMKMFHLTKRKTIDNWLYSGTLPRSLTVRIGRHVFFIKDKLEDFLRTVNEEQAANT